MKDANIKYMSVPAPIVEGGVAKQSAYLNGNAIPLSSKHPEAAWELLRFMMSKEGQMSFGKFSDLPSNTEAMKKRNASQLVRCGSGCIYGIRSSQR